MFYVYVLLSDDKDRQVYVGFTKDLRRRVKEHNSPENQGFTRGKKWTLVYYEAYLSKKDAHRRERRLKDDGRAKHQLKKRIKESMNVGLK